MWRCALLTVVACSAPSGSDAGLDAGVLQEDDGGVFFEFDAGARDVGARPTSFTIINGFAVLDSRGQQREVQLRLTGSSTASRFAIALGPSPLTSWFAETGPSARDLLTRLRDDDYRVVELKFVSAPRTCFTDRPGETEDGLLGFLCGQGLPTLSQVSAQLVDLGVQALGYDRLDRRHRLVGVGTSLGATVLALGALDQNRRFDKLALLGFLDGDRHQGCLRGQQDLIDELSWTGPFRVRADVFSTTLDGCTQAPGSPREYTARTNFDSWASNQKWQVALWSGDDLASGARPGQARFVEAHRDGGTRVEVVAGCGAEVLTCRTPPVTAVATWLLAP